MDVPPRDISNDRAGLRAGVKELRRVVAVGHNTVHRGLHWQPTPSDPRQRWALVIDSFGRADRDLPPHVVDGMFEDVIAEHLDGLPEPTAVLVTDGSVTADPPHPGLAGAM